ncbi:metal-dependent hydrolase [Natronorubrum tibetense]|uniref:Membrane-bound metal-dependent hydrolase n=1 Tax=Natronorubrum tibetense GA33 TaxID=1114856 RepID=L9VL35_9EURY|nr:metal-dependent hydrolase [Natronorubrum tibetense]ELY37672.1 membrane-bound metal-dependent hydrolase [Natronorubrum tibetense GA33]
MLPWEHAAVAYLCYTGYARRAEGGPAAGWAVLVVLLASQLPDLIDKPLAWQVGLVPSGRSVAHSVFVGGPLAIGAVVVARRYGRPALGAAFAIGYLSHLLTDVIPTYPAAGWSLESVLWPVATNESAPEVMGTDTGAIEHTGQILFGAYPSLLAPEALIGLGLVGLAGLVWFADGRPGVRECWAVVRWPIDTLQPVVRREQ